MTDKRIIANSSSGTGLRVSVDKGKRTEDFLNTESYWYYASEIYLGGSYYAFELKNPELGSLHVFRRGWHGSEDSLIAVFPKGTWEFVRLLEGDSDGSETLGYKDPDQDARHNCPEGCWVRGWENLGEETKKAHMDFNHSGGRKIYPN